MQTNLDEAIKSFRQLSSHQETLSANEKLIYEKAVTVILKEYKAQRKVNEKLKKRYRRFRRYLLLEGFCKINSPKQMPKQVTNLLFCFVF